MLVCAIFSMAILSSCGKSNKYMSNLDKDAQYVRGLGDQIMQSFDERDAETLKSLFCTGSKNYYDLDAEIQNAFSLYEGHSESYVVTGVDWGGTRSNGEYVNKHFTPQIKRIKTDKGKNYSIGFCVYSNYIYDENMVGIGVIALRDDSGTEIAGIGGYSREIIDLL
jgi:hypothetical protein